MQTTNERVRLWGRLGLIAYVLVLVALLAYASRDQSGGDGPVEVTSHADKRLGIKVQYPSDWHKSSLNKRIGFGEHIGFVISNTALRLDHPELPEGAETQQWDMRDFSDETVLVEYSLNVRFPGAPCERPIDRLPLDLSAFERVTDQPSYGSPPRLYYSPCLQGADMFLVHLWAFPDASEADVAAAKDSIKSLQLITRE